MSDTVVVALISTLGVVLVAIIGQGHSTRRAVRSIDDVVSRELQHNHGSSIKDDTVGTALSVGQLQRRVDTFLAVAAVHHPEHADLYLALRSDHDED